MTKPDDFCSPKEYIAAAPGRIFWNYTIPPDKGAKMQLLTVGGIQVNGRWYGEWGHSFLAWAPNIKRDKDWERKMMAARDKGLPLPTRVIPEPSVPDSTHTRMELLEFALLNNGPFTVEEFTQLEADLDLAALVRAKFKSGNEIPVERITVLRREIEEG